MHGLKLFILGCLFVILASTAAQAEEVDESLVDDAMLDFLMEKRSPLMKLIQQDLDKMPLFKRTKRGFLSNLWQRIRDRFAQIVNVVGNISASVAKFFDI